MTRKWEFTDRDSLVGRNVEVGDIAHVPTRSGKLSVYILSCFVLRTDHLLSQASGQV